MKKYKLSSRELEIMQILWNESTPLTALQISENAKFSKNTVNSAVTSLLNKGYIKVGDIGYSRTVLARKFSPTFSSTDYFKSNFSPKVTLDVVSNFISVENNSTVIDELEELLRSRKEKLGE